MLCLLEMLLLLLLSASGVITDADDVCDQSLHVAVFTPVNLTVKHVTSPKSPATPQELDRLCSLSHPGYNLLQQGYGNLRDDERELCGDLLVPLGILVTSDAVYWKNGFDIPPEAVTDKELKHLTTAAPHPTSLTGTNHFATDASRNRTVALNVTSNTWHIVDENATYRCAICQRLRRTWNTLRDIDYPPPPVWVTKVGFLYTATVQGEVGAAATSGEDINQTAEKLAGELAERCNIGLENIHLIKHTRDEGKRDRVVFNLMSPRGIAARNYNGIFLLGGRYRLIDLSRGDVCPEVSITYSNGKHRRWYSGDIDTVAVDRVDQHALQRVRSECTYNLTSGRATWSPLTYWDDLRAQCYHQQTSVAATYRLSDIATSLHRYATGHLVDSESQLDELGELVERFVTRRYQDDGVDPDTTRTGVLRDLEKILGYVHVTSRELVIVVKDAVTLLAANITGSNPVVGFSILPDDGSLWFYPGKIQPIRLDASKNMIRSTNIDFVLRQKFTSLNGNKRISFNIVPKADTICSIPKRTQNYALESDIFIQVAVVTNDYNAISEDEISFDIYLSTIVGVERTCVFWNLDGNYMSTDACTMLHSRRYVKEVCRCKLYRETPTTFSGTYLVLNSPYAPLSISLIIVSTFSLFGLLSITLTAVFIQRWREDVGHKILLHMTVSLTLNLVLGFTNSFVQVGDDSTGCVVIGVCRHFAYLSMFCWMLVLSGLQLKRLSTVLGSQTTANLVAKVAAFAWGAPLCIITGILIYDKNIYKSGKTARGFCYPQGTNFEVTVNAPTGLILVLNTITFILILTRICSCCGMSTNLERHMANKTLQYRRLRTSIFTFVLCGLAWVFHFLSQEGLIKNHFIYKYMFMMTASAHLFLLSLFCVFLDKVAMDDWRGIYRKVIAFEGWGKYKERFCKFRT